MKNIISCKNRKLGFHIATVANSYIKTKK